MTENGTNGNGKGAGLTLKQKVWLEEYLRCWNGAEAARIAGYKYPKQSAYDNITKPYLLQKIKERLASKVMLADEVLMRLSEQARVDVGQFFREVETDKGKSIAVDWDAILNGENGHLIRSITFGRDGPKIEVHDAQRALAHLAKYHGLATEKMDITTKGESLNKPPSPERVAEAKEAFREEALRDSE